MVQLPDGASVARTGEVTKRVEDILKGTPAVDHTMSIIGYSLLDGGNLPNAAFLVVRLKPFEDRTTAAASAQALIRKVFNEGSKIREANVVAFNFPPIIGLSVGGGFEYVLEALEGQEPAAINSVMGGSLARPIGITCWRGCFRPSPLPPPRSISTSTAARRRRSAST